MYSAWMTLVPNVGPSSPIVRSLSWLPWLACGLVWIVGCQGCHAKKPRSPSVSEKIPSELTSDPEQWHGQRVRLLGNTSQPRRAVVVMHGYGAPGDDLLPLAEALRFSDDTVVVVPEAILSLAPGARAWWHIDWAAIERAEFEGRPRRPHLEDPAGIPAARAAIERILARLATHGVPASAVTLMGFSQGGMLATETALERDEPVAAVVSLSGNLVAESRWRPKMSALASKSPTTKFFVSHGQVDPVLPFEGSVRLRDALKESGLSVAFHPFHGPHTIAPSVLPEIQRFLNQLAR